MLSKKLWFKIRIRRTDFLMCNRIHTLIISALSIVFVFSGMAFAKTNRIDVLYPTMVGKTLKLKPGNYKIDVVNNKKSPAVKFYNNYGKLVGQAPVKLVNESKKNDQTQVDYNKLASNDHAITEIRLRGWKQSLHFPNPKTSQVDLKN
jgi:hypothetical protein